MALTFATQTDTTAVRAIERLIDGPIERMTFNGGKGERRVVATTRPRRKTISSRSGRSRPTIPDEAPQRASDGNATFGQGVIDTPLEVSIAGGREGTVENRRYRA
jgi:hypothetical protein